MNLKEKNVLVIGFAVTGIPLVKVLCQLGANVIVNDSKKEEALKESMKLLSDHPIQYILGKHPEIEELSAPLDLVVVSPGVPLDIPFIENLRARGIEIIGEIELAYRLAQGHIVAITGTNGKTTTTSLVGEIFKNAGRRTHVVGNIGVAFISKALETTAEDVIVIEASSFQLESIVDFRPQVGAILNLTPDHLNRHKTMENYQKAKFNIFKNQGAEDIAVINYDDVKLREESKQIYAKKVYFSRRTLLEEGVFVEDGKIVALKDGHKKEIISKDDIFIPGNHNLENALAATAMTLSLGVDIDVIQHTLKTFKGVEHRTEIVDVIHGVRFINDSKGTNPDASIKGIEGINTPILLIAGGYDKGSDFDEFINAFDGKVKHMFVYGETANTLMETAKKLNFIDVTKVQNLDEAVKKAYDIAIQGDTVLLSPACASWDMYENFEMRGKHFKEIVANLRR